METTQGPKEVRAASAETKPGKARQIMLAPGTAIMQLVTNALAAIVQAAIGSRSARVEVSFWPATGGVTPKNPISVSKGKRIGDLAVRVSCGRGQDLYATADKLAVKVIRAVLYGLKGGTPTSQDVEQAELAAKGHITPEVVAMADHLIREAVKKSATLVRLRTGGHELKIGKGDAGKATYAFLLLGIEAVRAAIVGNGCTCSGCGAFGSLTSPEVWNPATKTFVPAPALWNDVLTLASPPVVAETEPVPIPISAVAN